MKRLAPALAVLLCLLSGCNRNQKKTVGVIPKGNAHLFWQSVHAGVVKGAGETGLDVVWNGPATETDYTGQLQIADAMINRRVSVLALAPIDQKALVSVVERAGAEHIPVIIFDSGISTESFATRIATDNYKAGQIAADRMGKILNEKGTVLIVAVQPGAASTEAREKGFEDAVRSRFPNIRIVDKRFGMSQVGQSLTVAENMITAHPDVDGMFASNESSAIGAAQAIRARSRRPKLVGFDSSPTLIEDVRSGLVDSLVIQDPFRMGQEVAMSAAKLLKGEQLQKIQDLEPKLVDKSNIDDPAVQQQMNPDVKKYLQ